MWFSLKNCMVVLGLATSHHDSKIAGTFAQQLGWVFVGPFHPSAHGPPAKLRSFTSLQMVHTHIYIYISSYILPLSLTRTHAHTQTKIYIYIYIYSHTHIICIYYIILAGRCQVCYMTPLYWWNGTSAWTQCKVGKVSHCRSPGVGYSLSMFVGFPHGHVNPQVFSKILQGPMTCRNPFLHSLYSPVLTVLII